MRKLVAILAAATVLLAAASPATAESPNRRRPPRIDLIYRGEVVQTQRPFTYCWSYSYPNGGGVGTCADGFPRYPQPARVQSGARLAIRVVYPVKPRRWYIRAYRLIVRHSYYDETMGPAERVAYRWKPHRSHGEIVAWDAVFRVTEPLRHYYIDTGGDLSQGDVFYTLHVRT